MRRAPNPELGLAILRVVLGVIFVAHGAPKLFGGVGDFAGFLGSLGVPLSGLFAWVVTFLEFFGGILLIAGFLVTPVALLLGVHMLTGIILVHAGNGFYVIGPGQGGVEFNLLIISGLLAMILAGPGLAALDSRGGVPEPGAPSGGPGASSPGGGSGAPSSGGGSGSPGGERPGGAPSDEGGPEV